MEGMRMERRTHTLGRGNRATQPQPTLREGDEKGGGGGGRACLCFGETDENEGKKESMHEERYI